ncbi:MAG: hypothetical protein ACRDNS_03835, partial [Trebonia sp.]
MSHALVALQRRYEGQIGFEFEHLASAERVGWWRRRIEATDRPAPSVSAKLRVLRRLLETNEFERFLQRTWVGQKTLSIEGLDVTVAMVEELLRGVAENNVAHAVIGMAHRGRLAMLTGL